MSEYQYYEFQAIDRPLSDEEMGELRSYSTRARITRMSFVNDYSWGSFKGDADAWMEKYFDAFLHLTNWGTHIVKLRLPSGLLDLKTAQEYCGGDCASVHEEADKVIVSFISEDEEGGEWVEGEGILDSMIAVRTELARGDLRALYLGWLLLTQAGELGDETPEPPVPPGLGELSASLDSLAEFLRIDGSLLRVAAYASASLKEVEPERDELDAWVAKLPTSEKDELLASLIMNADHAPLTKLLHRFLKQRSPGRCPAPAPRRTVGELRQAAETHAKEKQRVEAEKRAMDKADRERKAAIAREKHLDGLTGSESKLWTEVDSLIATKLPKSYDRAAEVLIDLRALDARAGGGHFLLRLEALRQAHARKPSFTKRLDRAGL